MSTRPADGGRGGAPVRVAMVGTGWAAGSIWLPRLRQHPDFTVTAVVDPDPAARLSAAAGDQRLREFSAVEELPADLVDLAVVAVPNHLHAPTACMLLAAGIPVFLEKPMCLTSDEARRLDAAERAGGAVLLAGSAARCRADVRALVRQVVAVGQIRHVELSWVRARGVPQAGGWFTRQLLAGGGALVDLGWHLLDILATLLGPVGYEWVVGTTSDDFVNDGSARATWRRDSPSGGGTGDVEDSARGYLVTEDGISVALRASWASHEATDMTMIRVDGSAGTVILYCTFGFSPNREHGSTLTVTRDGQTTAVPVPDEPVGAEYIRQLDELPGLLGDPASRGVATAQAYRTVDIIERIYESAHRVPAGLRRRS
jgi:oxidoreductase